MEFRRVQALQEFERGNSPVFADSPARIGQFGNSYIALHHHRLEQVLRAIRLTPPNVPIDLILHTPGGLVLATEQIARALIRHPAKAALYRTTL